MRSLTRLVTDTDYGTEPASATSCTRMTWRCMPKVNETFTNPQHKAAEPIRWFDGCLRKYPSTMMWVGIIPHTYGTCNGVYRWQRTTCCVGDVIELSATTETNSALISNLILHCKATQSAWGKRLTHWLLFCLSLKLVVTNQTGPNICLIIWKFKKSYKLQSKLFNKSLNKYQFIWRNFKADLNIFTWQLPLLFHVFSALL